MEVFEHKRIVVLQRMGPDVVGALYIGERFLWTRGQVRKKTFCTLCENPVKVMGWHPMTNGVRRGERVCEMCMNTAIREAST